MNPRCPQCRFGKVPDVVEFRVTGVGAPIVSIKCGHCDVPLSDASLRNLDERRAEF